MDYAVGSKEFLKNSSFVKVFDVDSLKFVKQIKYPKEFSKGLYQPTFYEPFTAIDEINMELEVIFPRLPTVFIYDLKTLSYSRSIGLTFDRIKFPSPVPWNKESELKNKFTQDHDLARIAYIDNVKGNTLIGYVSDIKKRTEELEDTMNYSIYDNDGKKIKSFDLNIRSLPSYIRATTNEGDFIGFANFSLLESELEGYPLIMFKLEEE